MTEDRISSCNFYEYHNTKRQKKLNISRNGGKENECHNTLHWFDNYGMKEGNPLRREHYVV